MAAQALPHVAVVGSGIVGASVAHQLALSGACRVTVLEQADRPGEGATGKSWAWLNANRKSPLHYKELNRAGMDDWRELPLPPAEAAALADFPGTICVGDDRENEAAYPSAALSPEELSRMEPGLAPSIAAQGGRLYKQEGYGFAAAAAARFLQAAAERGADVCYGTAVTGFQRDQQRVTGVDTSAGELPADVVVLAAGLGIPALAERLGAAVPLADKPGTLTVLTRPLPRLLTRIIVTEDTFIVQRRGGEVMISPFKPGANPAAGGAVPGSGDAAAEEPTDATAEQVILRAAAVWPGLADAQLGSWSLAKYPYPADAHPIVGWLPGLEGSAYVAVTHSGATLGPLLGRLAAAEVLGRPQAQLEPYRPGRDFGDRSHLY